MRNFPSAPLAAGSLLAGWAAVEASGSRPVGGAVMLVGGLGCVALWQKRHGTRTALALGGVGVGAFVLSHVLSLGLGMGPWPAVITVAAITALIVWLKADAPEQARLAATPELG